MRPYKDAHLAIQVTPLLYVDDPGQLQICRFRRLGVGAFAFGAESAEPRVRRW